jgi:hypothetical protein
MNYESQQQATAALKKIGGNIPPGLKAELLRVFTIELEAAWNQGFSDGRLAAQLNAMGLHTPGTK